MPAEINKTGGRAIIPPFPPVLFISNIMNRKAAKGTVQSYLRPGKRKCSPMVPRRAAPRTGQGVIASICSSSSLMMISIARENKIPPNDRLRIPFIKNPAKITEINTDQNPIPFKYPNFPSSRASAPSKNKIPQKIFLVFLLPIPFLSFRFLPVTFKALHCREVQEVH